jgi:hypothetical protein
MLSIGLFMQQMWNSDAATPRAGRPRGPNANTNRRSSYAPRRCRCCRQTVAGMACIAASPQWYTAVPRAPTDLALHCMYRCDECRTGSVTIRSHSRGDTERPKRVFNPKHGTSHGRLLRYRSQVQRQRRRVASELRGQPAGRAAWLRRQLPAALGAV